MDGKPPEQKNGNTAQEWIKAITYNPLVIIVAVLVATFNISSRMDTLSESLRDSNKAINDLSDRLNRIKQDTGEIRKEIKEK